MFGSVLRTAVSFTLWAAFHSLLATQRSKALAEKLLGTTRRNASYRLAYNGVALASTAALVVYIHRLPDRPLYRIGLPWRVATALLRLGTLGFVVAAAVEVGVGPFSGISELLEYLRNRKPHTEPEAQGPSLGNSGLRTSGPFSVVRHPLNFGATAIVLLTPRMTAVRLTVATLTVAYSVIGSKLE